MAGRRIGVIDAMFLALESRESMMHVGGLMPFTPPPDAPPDFLRAIMEDLRDDAVQSPWDLQLTSPDFLSNPLQKWARSEDFDLSYHVRRSALPSPGDERELGVLVSRLHSHPVDFHRPPWELHFIEGLSGGRFAMYSKVHHSLLDGYTAMKILASSFTTDPDERDTPLYFTRPPPTRSARVTQDDTTTVPTLPALIALVRQELGGTRRIGRAVANLARSWTGRNTELTAPLQAPRTPFNRRISRNRRFATQTYALARLKALAKATGGTLNDVALALCGAALRRLLLDLNALPDRPLVAMLPVNLRPSDDPGGGNAVGAILASLATDDADPVRRLETIIASTRRAKEQLQGMTRLAILEYSALLLSPVSVQIATGTAGRGRPVFNLVISNVPGPERPLYFRGARLEAAYPLSIPIHGYGLNITLNSYADTLNFGFIGCRDALPHLQRLAVYAGEALEELESAVLGPA